MSKGAIPHLLPVQDWGVDPSKGYPFDLPWARGLSLEFTTRVTFFVGENGSGKSTLREALADLCGVPVSGGGKNELGAQTRTRRREFFSWGAARRLPAETLGRILPADRDFRHLWEEDVEK